MAHVVIVEFRTRPDRVEAFGDLIDRHAHNSRTLEEGCIAFEVCQDPAEPTRFVLYEAYRDEVAHRQHREQDSFKWFMAEAPDLLFAGPDGLFHARQVLKRRAYPAA